MNAHHDVSGRIVLWVIAVAIAASVLFAHFAFPDREGTQVILPPYDDCIDRCRPFKVKASTRDACECDLTIKVLSR